MSIPTINLTVTVYDYSGAPVPGAYVTSRLDRPERYEGVVVESDVAGETDDAGQVVLAVFPNELGANGSKTLVRVSPPNAEAQEFNVVVPNEACRLEDILDLPTFPPQHWDNKLATVPDAIEGNLPVWGPDGKNLLDSGMAPADLGGSGGSCGSPSLSFTFEDFGDAQQIAEIPAGMRVFRAVLEVEEAFDSGQISIGPETAQGQLMAVGDSSLLTAGKYVSEPEVQYTTATAVNIYFTGSPTQGSAKVTLYCM